MLNLLVYHVTSRLYKVNPFPIRLAYRGFLVGTEVSIAAISRQVYCIETSTKYSTLHVLSPFISYSVFLLITG